MIAATDTHVTREEPLEAVLLPASAGFLLTFFVDPEDRQHVPLKYCAFS
jgi:hypothetical protein